MDEPPSALIPPVDIAIITIRQDEERAVLARMPGSRVVRGGRQIYAVADVPVQGGIRTVAVARCVEEGQSEAGDLARDVIDDLDPGAILVVGIGGGFPSADYCLGDVVVATRVQDLRVMALLDGKDPEYDVRGGPMAGEVKQVVGALQRMDLGGWNSNSSVGLEQPAVNLAAKNFYGSKPWKNTAKRLLQARFGSDGSARREPIFVTGAIVSTDWLVKQVAVVEGWKNFVRKAAACEMELAAVLHAANRPGRLYAVYGIRGISDVVGFRRAEDWTAYACATAAAFAFGLIRTGLVPNRAPSRVPPAEMQPRRSAGKETLTEGTRGGLFQSADGFVDRGDVETAVAAILHGTPYERAAPAAQLSAVAVYQKFGFLDAAWRCLAMLSSNRNLPRLDAEQKALCSVIEYKLWSQEPQLERVRDSCDEIVAVLEQAGLRMHTAAVYRRAAVACAALADRAAAEERLSQGLAVDNESRNRHSVITGQVFAAITRALAPDGSANEAIETLTAAPYVYLSAELDRFAFQAHPLKSAGMCLFSEASVRFVTLGENPAAWICLAAAHVLGGLASAHPHAEGYAELLNLLRSRERLWELFRRAMSLDPEHRRELHVRYPDLSRYLVLMQDLPLLVHPGTPEAWGNVRARLDSLIGDC